MSEYESKYMLTRNDSSFVPYISVQQMMWDPPWDHYPLQYGMLGFDQILKYTTNHGLVSATELPLDTSHAETPDPGWALASGWENRVWKTANYQWVSLDNLKNAIMTTGPIHMGFNADVAYESVADLKAKYKPLVNNGDNHAVSLVGFKDDPTCPNGGYWIIKNSWDTGWGNGGYGYVPYGSTLDINQHTFALGPVYYTGPMYHTGAWDASGHDYTGDAATNIWKGTTSGTWNTSSSTSANWSNKTTGAAFTWVNQELQAVFDNTATRKLITVSGKVIAHGLTVSDSGYSFAPYNSSSSLTITAGGLSTSEDLTFGATPIYIGGPQSWNVAAGKTLTVAGPLHTIVSDLTFSGAGNTVISGAIDGGGVLNANGAKPGGLIQAGTGSVTLSGTTNFSGNITVNSGTLNIVVPGGGPGTFNGAWSGGGTVNIDCGGTFTLGGGAANFAGTMNWVQPVSLVFTPASGAVSSFGGQINNNGSVTQNGPGTTVFADRSTNKNNYTGGTTIQQGVLQANIGNGIPTSSYLTLDGGILQNYGSSTPTFTRGLGTSGDTFAWTQNGGGFSAGTGPLTVTIPGGTLNWSSDTADIGSRILGTLKLSSVNASNVTTLTNSINLNGADRTIQVDDNPNSTYDNAVISGIVTGVGGIAKTGNGLLKLNGSNNYTGSTTIGGGILQATIGTTGIPTNSMIKLDGGVLQFNSGSSFTRSFGTDAGMVAWGPGGGGFSAGTSSLSVNIGNHATPDTLVWSDNLAEVGTKIFGPLTLNASTASNSLTFQNGLDLHGGARTIINDANTATISGAIIDSVGGGSLTKNGVGTLYLSGSSGNTYSGTTTVTRGYVYLNKTSGYAIPGNLTMSTPVDIPGIWTEVSETFVVQQRANQTSPTCVLSFVVNFLGDNFAHFQMNGFDTTLGGIAGIGIVQNAETESVGSSTLTINASADYWFGGYLRNRATSGGGAVSVVKTGTGMQTLSGDGIRYSGSTTISQGTLILENITNTSLLARNISVTGTGTVGLGCTRGEITPNFTGVISGTGGLLKTGGAAVKLSGSSGNTYTGATTITDGTLILAKTSGYAIPGDITISNANSFLVVQNPNQFPSTAKINFTGTGDPHFEIYGNTVTVGGISGTVGGAIENTEGESGPGNGTLIVNNTEDCSYSSYIRDNAGGSGTLSLVKSGPGKLTLPSIYSSYTGSTTISNGVLEANSGKGLPTASFLSLDGGVLQSNGSSAVSFLRGLAASGSGKFQMTASGGGFSAGSGPMNIFIGGGSGTVTWGDSVGTNLVGTLKLSSTNAANATTFNNSIALGSSIRTVQVDNNSGSSADYAVLAGTNSGTGGLMKTGDGLLVLSRANTYTGLTTVSDGALQIGLGANGSSVGSIAGNIFVDVSGALVVNRTGSVPFASKLSGTGTLIKNSSGTLTMTGSNSFSGNLTINGGLLDYSGNSTLPGGNYTTTSGTLNIGALSQSIGTFKITGGIVNGTGSLTSSSDYDVQGGIIAPVLAGSFGLVKTQDSIATLTGNNTYSGSTRIEAGTLVLADGGQIDPSSAISNNATLLIAGGDHRLGEISGRGTIQVCSSARLNVTSIVQGTLTLGGDYVPPGSSGSATTSANTSVPEPSLLVLLASLAVVLAVCRCKK